MKTLRCAAAHSHLVSAMRASLRTKARKEKVGLETELETQPSRKPELPLAFLSDTIYFFFVLFV